ncbi:c-type cytochrome [Pseudomarimonas arenosa]|uniref:Cytochrome c553 n=1 Tax=Pseudomarimonas arenosa TaxID=2774145 RepID=A0AAW3ZRP7_9GAMM|nr:hypothetical protein [Pseudomarimonas arenosa]MBD8526916.1 hypothetical protein [Pseudomarimonas arenosa]
MAASHVHRRPWLLLLVVGLFGSAVSADEHEPANPGSADTEACLSCHGSDGSSLAPILEGQDEAYLNQQIARFRDHARQSFPMDALTQGLDDKTIATLSRELASRRWPSPRSESGPAEPAVAATDDIDLSVCAECHGKRLMGRSGIPRLAGQRSPYLMQQLEAIADERRPHPGDVGKSPPWSRSQTRALAQALEMEL